MLKIVCQFKPGPCNPKKSLSLLSNAGEQLRKGVHLVEAETDLPTFFDTFDEYRDFMVAYRGSLATIARLTACLLPEPALAAASRRLSAALQLCSTSGAASAEVGANDRISLFTNSKYFLRQIFLETKCNPGLKCCIDQLAYLLE